MFDSILNILLPDYPTHPVFESAGGIHLPGSLKAPGVIDNQEQVPVLGGKQVNRISRAICCITLELFYGLRQGNWP